MLDEHDELPIAFTSGSMAEHHWPELFRVMHAMFLLWGRLEDANVVAPRAQPGNAELHANPNVFHILMRATSILNQVFVLRTHAWFHIVLEQGLGIDHHWHRYEFSKSRGAIHFHGILWKFIASNKLHSLLDRALQAGNMDMLGQIESEVAAGFAESLPEVLTPISALHPSGRVRSFPDTPCTTPYYTARVSVSKGEASSAVSANVRVGEHDVPWQEVGNVDNWPPHEGLAPKPTSDAVRRKVFQVVDQVEDMIEYINFAMLHVCNSYCLRAHPSRKGADGKPVLVCRMHFGDENPQVSSRTDGKPARIHPAFVERRNVTYLEMPRDHPRIVQGPHRIARAWCANYDFQPVVSLKTDVSIPEDVNNHMQWLHDKELEWRSMPKSQQDWLIELYVSRRYCNKDNYVSSLIDYCVGYACKGEISSTDAVSIFKKLVNNTSLSDNISFASLAQRLNMRILRTRELSAAEADFCLAGMKYYECTVQFIRISLNVGQRVLDVDAATNIDERGDVGDEGHSVVRANQFDKYLKRPDGDLASTFHKYNTRTQRIIPVYLHADMQPSWPISESYAKTMLLLHTPGLRTFADALGQHACYKDALEARLSAGSMPLSVVKGIRRAQLASYAGISSRGMGRAATGRGARGQRDDGSGDEVETPLSLHQVPDGVVEDAGVLFDDPNGLAMDDVAVEFDMGDNVHEASIGHVHDVDRSLYPPWPELSIWVENMVASFYANSTNAAFLLPRDVRDGHEGRFKDPMLCIDNNGQRILLCAFLHLLHDLVIWEQGDKSTPAPRLRGLVAGVAGTGKSFVVDMLRAFAMLATADPNAAALFAPTGSAAGTSGSSTVDRALDISRSAREVKQLAVKDPLKCAQLQQKYSNTVLGCLDEIGMWGRLLLGHFASRCDEVFNLGVCADVGGQESDNGVQLGGVPAMLFFGDHKQLPPVLDSVAFDPSPSSVSLVNMGRMAYASMSTCFLLDTPVRQEQDSTLLGPLTHLREGTTHEHLTNDLAFWNRRRLITFTMHDREESWGDKNPDVLVATCYNKDRDAKNKMYVSHFRDVCVVHSINAGKHARDKASNKAGGLKSIPRTTYLAPGMMVKLTTNICPEFGLHNNARGIVRDVVYPNGGGYDSSLSPIVMVEFPKYIGPPISQAMQDVGLGKHVPIACVHRRCDCKACTRTGLPLVVAKADSVHSTQGLTVGDSQPIKRIVLCWNKAAEGLWPGILYVGASRAEKEHNLAIDFSMTTDDLGCVGKNARWEKQDAEVKRISNAALAHREQMSHAGQGSKQDFVHMLGWLCTHARALCGRDTTTDNIRQEVLACVQQWEESTAQWLVSNGGV
jgi:hypothetical protein